MKDVQRIPYRPSNILQTKPRNPPTHETVKETSDRPRAPARQSEMSSQIDTKSVVSEILNNTEVQIKLGTLLGTSKEISYDLQERLRPRNRPVEVHRVAARTDIKSAPKSG